MESELATAMERLAAGHATEPEVKLVLGNAGYSPQQVANFLAARRLDAARRAQELVCSFVPADVSLVDELIESRRREARLEQSGFPPD